MKRQSDATETTTSYEDRFNVQSLVQTQEENAEMAVTKEGIIDLCDDLEGSEAGAAEHDESPSKKQKCHKCAWTREEDARLLHLVSRYTGCQVLWHEVSAAFHGFRSAKRCRERWVEYVDPSLNTSPFTPEEDEFILAYQAAHGNRWKMMAEKMHESRRSSLSIRARCNYLLRMKERGSRKAFHRKQRRTSVFAQEPCGVPRDDISAPLPAPSISIMNTHPLPLAASATNIPLFPLPIPHRIYSPHVHQLDQMFPISNMSSSYVYFPNAYSSIYPPFPYPAIDPNVFVANGSSTTFPLYYNPDSS